MTWLKGQSTWATICDDLTKLACGEMADDSAVTCASGDRWVRDISTSFNLIRSHASKDVNTGTVSNRAGYFSLMSSIFSSASQVPPNDAGYTSIKSVLRQTAVWSGVPTGVTNNRWMMLVLVNTANTVASNYSTARLTAEIWDPDTNLMIGAAQTTIAPNAAGDATLTFGTKTISINVSDPSGTLIVSTIWLRGFTSVYLGGIDWFGGYWTRRSGNATFTINPPGSSGTDYDANVEIATPQPASTTITNFNNCNVPQGGPFGGVGIKTNSGLTGAKYSCSWNMAKMKLRMVPQSGASNGQITLEHFGGGQSDAGTFRRTGGATLASWLRPYATPGSVTPGSLVQYWMSVKSDKIIVILNADPGQTGVLTTGGVYPYTTYNYGGWDPLPMLVSNAPIQSETSGIAMFHFAAYTIAQMRARLDGSEGTRDWQTSWMRTDFGSIFRISDNAIVGSGDPLQLGAFSGNGYGATTISTVGADNNTGTVTAAQAAAFPRTSSKPAAYTGKWAMYGFSLVDYWTTSKAAFEYSLPRGYIDGSIASPFLFLPGGLWASGDELTDAISGAKWFLVNSLYSGLGTFYTAGLGGIAVLEE